GARATAPEPERRDAPRAVAALLDFAPVGIEDSVGEARARLPRRLEYERLIETDPAAPLGEPPQRGGRGRSARRRVEYDEVVAEAVHLREVDAHGTMY